VGDELWLALRTHEIVMRLDPGTGRLVGRPIAAGTGPIALAVSGRTVWVADYDGGAVLRLDARTGRRLGPPLRVPRPAALAVAAGRVWVAEYLADAVQRLDAATGRPVGRPIRVDRGPVALAAAGRSIWVAASFGGRVTRLDARSGRVTARIPSPHPISLAAGGGRLWVANGPGPLLRLDPAGGRPSAPPLPPPDGRGVDALVAGGRSLWALDEEAGTVSRLDPRSGRTRGAVHVPSPAGAVARGGALWVAGFVDGSVTRVQATAAGIRAAALTSPLAGEPGTPAERATHGFVPAPPGAPSHAGRGDARPRGAIAGGAAGLVAALLVAAWLWWRRRIRLPTAARPCDAGHPLERGRDQGVG
jgi:streptogramin lyase